MFGWLFAGILTTGLVLLFDGVVQLCVRKKTGPWKEGGASLLAGAIIAGVSVFVTWLIGTWWFMFSWYFSIAGLVLAFNGVVQLSVRKKTGAWKEGGASLLAGAILVGVSVFLEWLTWSLLTGLWSARTVIWWSFLITGLVLAFNGVVQLCVRKKTGPWKEGGASLLAGAIIAGVSVFLVGVKGSPHGFSFTGIGSIIAGVVLALNGVVQLCVRKKTGPWKEGGASLLAGAILVGVWVLLLFLLELWGL